MRITEIYRYQSDKAQETRPLKINMDDEIGISIPEYKKLPYESPQKRTMELKLIDFLEKNCSEVISEINDAKRFMHRGYATPLDQNISVLKDKSVSNRIPRDSDAKIQKLFDAGARALGFTALRSNSTFVSGGRGEAAGYGKTWMIFPINGKYSYTWSPCVSDLILKLTDDKKICEPKFLEQAKYYLSIAPTEELKEIFEEIINRETISRNSFNILAVLKHPFATEFNFYNPSSLYKPSPEKIQRNYGLRNTGLVDALRSTHEIMLHGEYFIVNQFWYIALATKFLY